MPPSPPAFIPDSWRIDVVRVLRTGSNSDIEWTGRARQDWGQFGLVHQAYELLIRTLSIGGVIGREVPGMDATSETWEFLCAHPLGISVPLYVKIGLKQGLLRIKIFSTHVDLSGELVEAIKRFQRQKNK